MTHLARFGPAALVVSTLALAACTGGGLAPNATSASQRSLGAVHVPSARARSVCPTETCIYVANPQRSNSLIVEFPTSANGKATPVGRIVGAKTGLGFATTLAVDANYNLYAASYTYGNDSLSEISIFAPGATGNVAPTGTITGSNTQLAFANGIAVDAASNIYVTNEGISGAPAGVLVFAAGATGNVAPIQTIIGTNTGLNTPFGIAVDSGGNAYVANEFAQRITVYAPGANGNVAPIRTLAGVKTLLSLPVSVAVDSAGNLYVANYHTSAILVFPPGATGDVAPLGRIAGSNTGLLKPQGVAVDATGQVYVSNFKTDEVTVYAAGALGNVAPIATIGGFGTGLLRPDGIAVR